MVSLIHLMARSPNPCVSTCQSTLIHRRHFGAVVVEGACQRGDLLQRFYRLVEWPKNNTCVRKRKALDQKRLSIVGDVEVLKHCQRFLDVACPVQEFDRGRANGLRGTSGVARSEQMVELVQVAGKLAVRRPVVPELSRSSHVKS